MEGVFFAQSPCEKKLVSNKNGGTMLRTASKLTDTPIIHDAFLIAYPACCLVNTKSRAVHINTFRQLSLSDVALNHVFPF